MLVEVNCETDFVAKTDDFTMLVKDIAMHIAAANPLYIERSEVSVEEVDKEKEIFAAQARESGKPDTITFAEDDAAIEAALASDVGAVIVPKSVETSKKAA